MGELAQLRDRHAAYYEAYAHQMSVRLMERENRSLFAVLDADHDEFRAAIDWAIEAGTPAVGLRIGFSLWRYWQQQGHLAEGRARLERLLAMPAAQARTGHRVHGLAALGGVRYWQGDILETRDAYEEALEISRELDDSRLIAESLYDLGFPVAIGGQPDKARPMQQEALVRFEALGDYRMADTVREAQAVLEVIAGNYRAARDIEETVTENYRRAGRNYKVADGLTLLTLVNLKDGDVSAACRSWVEGTSTSLRIGDFSLWATALQIGAALEIERGDAERAAVLVGALEAFQEQRGPFLLPALSLGIADPAITVRETLPGPQLDDALRRGRAADVESLLQEQIGRF
jgi:non-specific serine/threonine protein kinase